MMKRAVCFWVGCLCLSCATTATDVEVEDMRVDLDAVIDAAIPPVIDASPPEGPGGDCFTPCEAAEDCTSGICIRDPNGDLVCTCRCGDCPPGWECDRLANAGPDATFICLPRPTSLCTPCVDDAGCDFGGLCLADGTGVSFCGQDCEDDGFCPRGFSCVGVRGGRQCVADDEAGCAECADADRDGFGLGDGCLGRDCDDADPTANPEARERCNDADDDCDGLVDESEGREPPPDALRCPTVGECVGSTAACVEGAWTCAPSSPDYEPEEQSCDGLDNDCDGQVDDVPGRGEICVAGLGECAREGIRVCDPASGSLRCSADPDAPSDEICNGLDDDCDGLIDDVPGAGVPCERGLGACQAAGEMRCDLATRDLACSAPAREPALEICDARDNDCDGVADEGLLNACGGCGPVPEERCNQEDEDCDGQIDEGVSNACGRCGPVPAEVCNGRDDDCDGQIDEGVANACGGCGEVPVEVCDGRDDDCDGQVDEGALNPCGRCGPVPAEACNGLDDDCDGRADEALARECFEAPPALLGVGACRAGRAQCVDGAWAECVGQVVPEDERCNAMDDDCDGRLDEGALNRCGGCGPEPAELCNDADDDCDGSIDEGLTNRCGGCGPEPAELCNDADDDCDGSIDEGVSRGCQTACGLGEELCVRGRWGACDAPQPALEICNGRDDDCDGRSDEEVANACGGCGAVPVEVCNRADDDCDGRLDEGVQNRCGDCGLEPVEVCNRGDDDCDGQIDEGVQNRCGGCGAEPAEVCNGRDDDCDGGTDEGLFRECRSVCGVGREQCIGGGWGVCDAQRPQAESCDGQDEDCDGRVDEGVQNRCGGCGLEPAEVCNGRDDDCDGRSDEQVLNACGQCGAVPVEVCNGRDDDCDGRADERVLNACGQCGAVPAELCNGRDDDCDGRSDEGVRNACGQCGAAPDEICNGRDDDCDGRTDEGGALCGGGLCVRGACCDDADRDGHADQRCGGDDCDDGDRYKHPGRREVHDIRDNDCDGDADDEGLVRYNRYYRAWTRVDWEHRFARSRPASFEAENPQHYVRLYPTNVCGSAYRPDDQCDPERVPGDPRSAADAFIRLRHGLLVALRQCTGILGQHHVSLALTEDSGEYRDYRDENPRRLTCTRIGYVYGGVTWRNVAGGTALFYRHRSAFNANGKGDNMWSTEPREGEGVTYTVHGETWRAKDGF